MLGQTSTCEQTPVVSSGKSPWLLGSSGGLHTPGGLFDKSCDSLGLRHVDGMAALDLNHRRARPLGHGTLGIRWNHLVVGSDQVPARLGLPRRLTDLTAESLQTPWDLGVGHERGFFCLHVTRERGGKLRSVEEQITILRRQYRRYGRAGRRILDQRGHGLALVRSKGGDIHEPCNPGIVSGFRDHRSSIGVADENCRPVLRCKSSLGSRHVALQRYRGVLDDADIVAVLFQDTVDALPARAVHKSTVDQNDVVHCSLPPPSRFAGPRRLSPGWWRSVGARQISCQLEPVVWLSGEKDQAPAKSSRASFEGLDFGFGRLVQFAGSINTTLGAARFIAGVAKSTSLSKPNHSLLAQ